MFDIQLIRENSDAVQKAIASKNVTLDPKPILDQDVERRSLIVELDELRNQKNQANEAIGKLKREQQDATEQIAAMKDIAVRIGELEPKVKELGQQIDEALLAIPNMPHESVPVGGVDKNEVFKTWGEPVSFPFTAKTHVEIAERLDIIDFKRGTKLSGSNFILYKREGAQLERALLNFMLDVHTRQHGYTEVMPPVVVNRASMTGTGQLPKMEDDMYRVEGEDLFLIPTAEVPVTNIHRDEILVEEDLPVYYTAFTPCFRREAGSYGKDTKGLMRVHQFDKVEMVKFVKPETSYDELELLRENAERIFQLLELPYRVLILATGDLSFAAAKCYDIEAHAAGLDRWLECSSCSNFEAFQARRAAIRFKGKTTKKPTYVHTLNGSGVALARTMIAILENYQTKEGNVLIPKVLQPYMGGLTKIAR